MIKPTLEKEKQLWASGIKLIGGIDEAGRGAWAGPVVAAVVILPQEHRQIADVRDSKLLSPKRRAELFEVIQESALDYGIGIVSHEVVDSVGVLEATKKASYKAIKMLRNMPEYLLCDALDISAYVAIDQEAVIRGDQSIYTISCASILAKVTRDNLMSSLGSEYDKYDFSLHKGYGTKLHQQKLVEHGVCDIHRKSYRPIRELIGE